MTVHIFKDKRHFADCAVLQPGMIKDTQLCAYPEYHLILVDLVSLVVTSLYVLKILLMHRFS